MKMTKPVQDEDEDKHQEKDEGQECPATINCLFEIHPERANRSCNNYS
jgi:hypothetical protein